MKQSSPSSSPIDLKPSFVRHGIILKPSAARYERLGVINPPAHEERDGTLVFEEAGFALEPEAPPADIEPRLNPRPL